MLDPDELLMRSTPAPGQDQDMLDWGTSQVLQASMDTRRPQDQTLELMEDDLGLDIGQDLASPQTIDRSIEVGRRAESARPDLRDESMLYHDDLGLDLGLDEPTEIAAPAGDEPIFGQDDDIQMGGLEEFAQIEESNLTALARAEEREQRRRESASPLSSIGSEQERELEQTFQLEQAAQHEAEEDEAMVQAAQRVKRRRVLQADTNTELHNSQIKAQQEDRSRILRAPNFLPRDPLLLTLMQMQKNGGFVSSILGDGRSMGWAPELRGVLSLEVVRRTGELKRKRDSGIADIVIPEEEEELAAQGGVVQTPQLELEEEQQFELGPEPEMDLPPTFSPPPADVPLEEEGAMSPAPGFDETTIPLLHPAESGPVSLGTKHAVHLLREHFSSAAGLEANEPPSPGTRRQQSVQFTELCPEERTSRQDATKMFFEMLVLGTKDAIKVEQDPDVLGAPIRVRGKRGLWGDWAEMGAGGEIASQSQGGAVQATEIAV